MDTVVKALVSLTSKTKRHLDYSEVKGSRNCNFRFSSNVLYSSCAFLLAYILSKINGIMYCLHFYLMSLFSFKCYLH